LGGGGPPNCRGIGKNEKEKLRNARGLIRSSNNIKKSRDIEVQRKKKKKKNFLLGNREGKNGDQVTAQYLKNKRKEKLVKSTQPE